MGRYEAKRRQAAGVKTPQIQFTQTPNTYKRDGGSRARRGVVKTQNNAAEVGGLSGGIIRAFGTEYNMGDPAQAAAYKREQSAELERQRGRSKMSDIRGGDGVKGYENGELVRHKDPRTAPVTPTRNVTRDGSQGTQTSPSPAKPGDLNAFADLLGSKYGIQFRNGFESNKLPGNGIGPVVDGDEYGKHLNATKGTTGIGPFADGDTYARAINGNKGEIAEGAQKGTSAVPDVGDQKRAVRVGRFDPRQRDGGSSSFMAEDSGPIVEQGPKKGGISARSRSFLDYDGPGGSMMALRAAEAESGYIRQNGKNYGISGSKDGKREFTEFSDEGRRALVKDGNAQVSQKFLKDYMVGETDAKAAENPAVEAPVQVQPRLEPNSNMGPLADSEKYGQMVDATRGMTGMGPLANGEVYGQYLDGRAPMMRDPRKK